MGFNKGDFGKEKVSFNVAWLKKGGERFEIVIDPDLALKYVKGEPVTLREVVSSEAIFSDANKGLRSSEVKIKQVFGTDDFNVVADKILKEGKIQFNEEYRKKMIEDKKRRIIDYIHTNAIDPTTKLPHPPSRIENAMNEAKIHIDPLKSEEEQILKIIDKLKYIIPIKIDVAEYSITVSAISAGKVYSTLKKYATEMKEKWLEDGSLFVDVKLPGGLKEEFLEQIESKTKGEAIIKEIKK